MWGKDLIGGLIGDIGGMKERRWSKRKQKVVYMCEIARKHGTNKDL